MVSRDPYQVNSVDRLMAILDRFTLDQNEWSLTELVAALGLPKGTVYRLLVRLEAHGYVEQDPANKRYRLGLKILDLAQVVLNKLDVRRRAFPVMERLLEETNENVNLAIRDGVEIVYLERIESRQFLNMQLRVGSRLPLHVSSMGKALIAFLPPSELTSVLGALNFQPFTDSTIIDRQAFETHLAQVRKLGYALNEQELAPDLITVAAPIFGHDGSVIAALNVSAPSSRVTQEKLTGVIIPAVLRAGAEASRLMGAPASHQFVQDMK